MNVIARRMAYLMSMHGTLLADSCSSSRMCDKVNRLLLSMVEGRCLNIVLCFYIHFHSLQLNIDMATLTWKPSKLVFVRGFAVFTIRRGLFQDATYVRTRPWQHPSLRSDSATNDDVRSISLASAYICGLLLFPPSSVGMTKLLLWMSVRSLKDGKYKN